MRCLNCKRDGISLSLAKSGNCPHCGVYFPSLLRNTLPIGTLLHDGKYRIDYPLGQGGFGITYRGFHTVLERELAIKEFYPDSHALRQGDTGYVAVTAGSQDAYERGKARFFERGEDFSAVRASECGEGTRLIHGEKYSLFGDGMGEGTNVTGYFR